MRRCWLVVVMAVLVPAGWSAEAPAPEPLATAGGDHAAVVSALIALGRGDTAPLAALPAHLISDAPAVADPGDAQLARRWTCLVPAALARLPPAAAAAVAAQLDERFRQAGTAAVPWDYLPAPAARTAMGQAFARAFDQGRLLDVLLLGQALGLPTGDPRLMAARGLLGLGGEGTAAVLPLPALPVAGEGPAPAPPAGRLTRGDGWVFGLDPAGRVRWQRQVERMARIALGSDAALVAETAGLDVITLDGGARRLPPLPAFARPLAVLGGCAWFAAGTTAWRLDVERGTRQQLVLPEAPLGPPVLHGGDAWWLTRTLLLVTREGRVIRRMPHLLALSLVANLEPHPRGAVLRDGARWWLVGALAEAPPLARAEAQLLAGEREAALATLAGDPSEAARALRVRITLREPRSDQECALVALAAGQVHDLPGNPLLSEPATDLALPVAAWPQRMTLEAWTARADGVVPTVRLLPSDGLSVHLEARWSATRWWERSWPTRPLLDAPSRSWAVIDHAVAVADGAGHLLVVDLATGTKVVEADVPADVDPSTVVRCGDHAAALLADLGGTLLIVEDGGVRRVHLESAGQSISATSDAVVVLTAKGESRVPLR